MGSLPASPHNALSDASPARARCRPIKQALEADPPYGAEVRFDSEGGQSGWHAPPLAPWLETAVAQASEEAFGKPAAYMGEGGTIPFMGMLGEKFPDTQFVITGVLGPHSNAHGPNEFLHIPRNVGAPGLRVIDASIMPAVVRANRHLTPVMIAEKMADALKSASRCNTVRFSGLD